LVAYHYHSKNTIKQRLLVKKSYEIKFTKLISIDIEKYLYMIFILKGIYTHPSSPSNQVPIIIHTRLQELIHQVNNNNADVTSTHIIMDK